MEILKILKTLTSRISSTTKTFSKSFKAIDDLIEKEHITGSIDKIKEFSGDVVMKAGEIMEKGKMKVEVLKENNSFKPIGELTKNYKNKIEDFADGLSEKIDDITDAILDEEE